MAEVKRGRGRPPKDGGRQVKANTALDPDIHAAWKASGRTLNELVRAGLVSLEALP